MTGRKDGRSGGRPEEGSDRSEGRPQRAAIARVRGPRVGGLVPLLLALLGAALITRSDLFLYLLYTLLGVYLLSRLWARRALASVAVERLHDGRAFLGQSVPVQVRVRNRSRLPVLWLHLADSLPSELGAGQQVRQVLSLLPRESACLDYRLTGRHRGLYHFGPVVAQSGDLLGTAAYESRQADGATLVVYPKIVPLPHLALPSLSPLGTLPSRQRLFEDPSRVQGVRPYRPGDSLRRMDWKTSARSGTLQVRRFEPAIALETALFLDLSPEGYPLSERHAASELAIVIAASLAVHVAGLRQAVGLFTNGRDPGVESREPAFGSRDSTVGSREPNPKSRIANVGLPPRKGHEHLMHLLDLLARVEVAPEEGAVPLVEMVSRQSVRLPWGSTAVVISGREREGLLDALLALRRRGLAVVWVVTCPDRDWRLAAARAAQIGVRAVRIGSERDLEAWR